MGARWAWVLVWFACRSNPGSSPDATVGIDATSDALNDAWQGPNDPPLGPSLTGLELFDGWTDPRALAGDVNTTGWEDSAFIAPSGQTLYFGYTRWDFDALSAPEPAIVITGPARPGQDEDSFDIWEGTLGVDGFILENSSVNAPGDLPEAAQGVDRTETRMVFARFVGPGELYQSTRASRTHPWEPAVALPAPFASACNEDNPTLTPDGDMLFFDSDRADPSATACKEPGQPRDLYVATRAGDGWNDPILVEGSPNQGITRWQPFATAGGESLYWSGANAADCTSTYSCIYRAQRQGDGTYAGATLVARAVNPLAAANDGDVIALGEVSISEDGRWMYFVFMQRVDAEHRDLSIGVARRE